MMEQGGEVKRERSDDIRDRNDVYLYFVLREHLCRVKLNLEPQGKVDKERRKPLHIEMLLHFTDNNLPVGMGAFTIGSKLYLLGGEFLKKGHRPDPVHLVSKPELLEAVSDKVFLCEHYHHTGLKLKQVSSMNSPKPCPQVAVIDNKVYVFAGNQYCDPRAPQTPMFECYDLSKKIWQVLPDPPIYNKNRRTSFLYLSVLGRKIITSSPMGIWSYDVDDGTWNGSRGVASSLFDFPGASDQSDEGILVTCTTRGVVAYLDYNLDRSILDDQDSRSQVLKDLNFLLPRTDLSGHATFIRYLGGHRFCLFLSNPYAGLTGEWEMHIIIFRLERLKQGEEDQTHEREGGGEGESGGNFCRVSVCRYEKYYDASTDINIKENQFNPTHAFIVREGFDKLGLHCFGVDEGKVGLHSAKGSSIEASSTEVASQIEELKISSNPSITGAPNSSAPLGTSPLQRIQELTRKIHNLKIKRVRDKENAEEWEGMYKKLILLEHEKARIPHKGGLDSRLKVRSVEAE